MEATSTTQTTRRVIIEGDIPEPAIAGLVEFIDRYYLPPKTGFIEALPYRKTESGIGFELFSNVKPIPTEEEKTVPLDLRLDKGRVELDVHGLDPNE